MIKMVITNFMRLIVNLAFMYVVMLSHQFYIWVHNLHFIHLDFTHKTKILQCENIAIFNEVRKTCCCTILRLCVCERERIET